MPGTATSATPAGRRPTLAVFASDKGPGDPERASLMSQAGAYLARRGARILCLADRSGICVPVIASARIAGGDVVVVAEQGFSLPTALAGIGLETLPTREACLRRVAALADAYVGLPGSLVSVHSLYSAWLAGGGGQSRKPVVFLNRRGAFDVVRGYAADVMSRSVKDVDKIVQFTDSIEDLWNRIGRLI